MQFRYAPIDKSIDREIFPASRRVSKFSPKKGKEYFIYARASKSQSAKRGSLLQQVKDISQEIELKKGNVCGIEKRIGSGQSLTILRRIFIECREKNLILVVWSVDRLIRSWDFHSKDNLDAVAGVKEWEELLRISEGVEIESYIDPDATPEQVRSKQRIRGQLSRTRGGRKTVEKGFRKSRREKYMAKVLEMSSKGFSSRAIAEWVTKESGKSISHMAVYNWIQESSTNKDRGSMNKYG